MSLVLSRDLDHITAARLQRLRPAKFRSLLPIDGSVPIWADRVEHSEVSASSEEPVPVGNGPVKNLPRVTLSKAEAYVRVINFGLSYGYTNMEREKASRTGVRLSAALPIANQGKVERMLDSIAAGEKLSSLGLPGLLNDASVDIYTASAKAGGGTAWTGATFDEIVGDVANSLGAIYDQTLENYEGDLIILPPSRYRLLTNVVHPNTSRSVLSLLQEMFPGVRFIQWQRTALADAAGTGPRMITMATGDEVARMIVPRELSDDPPLQEPGGIMIPQFFSTAGVLIETPKAIAYTDGV